MSPSRTRRPAAPTERRARRVAIAVGSAVVVGTAAIIVLIQPESTSTTTTTTLPASVTSTAPVPTVPTGISGITANLGTAPNGTPSTSTP